MLRVTCPGQSNHIVGHDWKMLPIKGNDLPRPRPIRTAMKDGDKGGDQAIKSINIEINQCNYFTLQSEGISKSNVLWLI